MLETTIAPALLEWYVALALHAPIPSSRLLLLLLPCLSSLDSLSER